MRPFRSLAQDTSARHEDLIGMALFVRGPRSVLPTTAGEISIE
ncbi:LysR family transcriptional regulator [Nonomuraea sp. PA05]|nr:LysR family transcriptional regulator [Nonomuraea sp. PA05]TYB56228.1 LysR family transcriptional regulator [Nonomuraea sp. PA05]